ncbi:MAG: sugar phosphate nucleotidyltransferase [Candidatus Hodarchaeota archaeon]
MKGLVLAAGEGRRMQPLSDFIPKPLLPLLNRPVLDWIISSLREAGINEIGVVISPAIPSSKLEALDCEFFVQEEPLGVGAAILEAEKWLDSSTFLVCAGDSVFPSAFLRKFVQHHLTESPDVTIATEVVSWPIMGEKSCVILDEKGNVKRIIEKPAREEAEGDLAAAPIFIFKQSILSELKIAKSSPRGEIEVQATIQSIIDEGGRVVSIASTRWVHLSDPKDLFNANMYLLEQKESKGEIEPLKKDGYHSPAIIASSAKIGENCIIGPRVVIGDRATVSPGVHLQDVLVLPDTEVQSSFKNAILWPKGVFPMTANC